jgi:hypothetical protein
VVTTSESELDLITTSDCADAAVARIRALHPNDTASTTVRTVTVGRRYAHWVHEQTTTAEPELPPPDERRRFVPDQSGIDGRATPLPE